MMIVVKIIFWTLAAGGHLALLGRLLNRSYRLGLPKPLWFACIILLAAAGITLPWLLVATCDLPLPFPGQMIAPPFLSTVWLGYGFICLWVLCLQSGHFIARRRAPRPHLTALISSRRLCLDRRSARADDNHSRVPLLSHLPFNEIRQLEVVERQLFLPALPPAWDGLSILHLSDLHLNGTPGRAFYEQACAAAAHLRADMAILTGDIVDCADYLDWLPSTLGRIAAPLGRFFVLGNHDMHHARTVAAAVEALGYRHIGGRWTHAHIRGATVLIAGTERPWVPAHPDLAPAPACDFRILISHTPDCLPWAQRHGINLMLAGHLHGGQVRLPWVGAWHAGPYPGGVYAAPPTLLHVSRGLGQVTPVRWHCCPEVTRLVLRRVTQVRAPTA